MKTILVTGGAGFIGSNFIKYMLAKHDDVKIVNLDKLTYAGNSANLKSVKGHYEFVQGDICDKELVNSLVKNVDLIVHFAAESHVDKSITNNEVFVRTNVIGTLTLLNAALSNGKKRFHHISTDEVFGMLDLDSEEKFSEISQYQPNSIYSASKAGSDHLVRAFGKTYGLPVTISNCSNNYGPFQHPEKLMPLVITNLLRGKKIPIYGDGLNVRDWLFVKDHCKAIDLILDKGVIGETYCVGGDCEKSNISVVKTIINELGLSEGSIEFVSDRPGHDLRYAIDSSKLKSLGWHQDYDFEKGIKETIQWYKSNESWWKPLK